MNLDNAFPPFTVGVLHRTDPTWDGISGFLMEGFPVTGDGNTYAILRVPEGSRQQPGWYALKAEPVQRALETGLVVSRTDGWCRGLRFLDEGQPQCHEDMGQAYEQLKADFQNDQNKK